jgi:hypothetical protein
VTSSPAALASGTARSSSVGADLVGLFRRLGAQGGDGAVVDDVPAKAEGEVNLEWKVVRMAGRRNRADEPPMASFAPDALMK